MVFDKLDPIGDWRADLRIAQLTAYMLNAWTSKDSKPLQIEDVMLDFDRKQTEKRKEAMEKQEYMRVRMALGMTPLPQDGEVQPTQCQ